MRVLVWIFRALIFFTLFAFALNNQQIANVRWFFGVEWHAPMVIVVLVVFAAGCALGVLAMVPSWWRHRREALRLSPAPAAAPQPAASRNDSSISEFVPEHPPREGLLTSQQPRCMDFDLQWLLIALPVVFALGWVASRFDLRQVRRDGREAPKAYFKGLNLLLNEQHDKAIDAFIEAVQHDPDTTELHFGLGNLFRRRGDFERAVRVHQHLLERADLKAVDRHRAQHALADDFMKAGLFDRAEAAYKALEGTAFDGEARLALLSLHERARDWRAATEVASELERRGSGSFATRIAHYACELALQADAAGQPAQAEQELQRARTLAPRAAAADAADRPAPGARRRPRRGAAAVGPDAGAAARRPGRWWRRTTRAARWPAPTAAPPSSACRRPTRPSPTSTCCRRASNSKARRGSTTAWCSTTCSASPRWARRPRCWNCRWCNGTRPRRSSCARWWRPRRGRCSATAAPPAASRRTTTSGNARAARAGTPTRRGAWRRL